MSLVSKSDGRTSVYIARECLKSYRVVFRVQLDSLLSPKFNPIIDKLKQFGIVNHWKNEDLDNVRRVSASGSGTRGREDEERNLEDNRAIKLDIMQGPFLLFLGMLLASSLAFAIEIIAWKTFGMSIKSDQ